MNLKKKIMYGVLAVILLSSLTLVGKLFEEVDAGEIVVIQDLLDGELHVIKEAGPTWQGLGKVTHYKKSSQFWFTYVTDGKDTTENRTIPVKWNDGGKAAIEGSIRYDLPLSDAEMKRIHSTFGSQEAIERDLIKTNIEKAVNMTGPLMTSKESFAEKKKDFIFYKEDQASKGVYRTRQITTNEIDTFSKQEKTITKVEIINDSKGMPLRQEISPIVSCGIRLYNISIKDMHYSRDVEDQIRVQQQATMQVQTAIANAKKAEQDALTTAKQGEADATKAKWDQEVVKAKLVTEAEQRKRVAELDVQTAQLKKQKDILEGEGEAAKKRLAMQANGGLEQKLEAWIKVQGYWSTAFERFQGNMVPLYQSGGGNTGNTNALNFMELMMMKSAKDLNLDLTNKK